MIGLETEYGIYVEGKGAQDLVAEATYLVKAAPGPVATGWDYKHEHPRRDMRGFTVDHLSVDPNDAQFEQSGKTHLSDIEVRSDRVLPNGARLYNDHGHPEYSTPECTSLRELIANDRAGERIVQRCAERRMARNGGVLVALYKNNTDFHGASYGTHESYLVQRDLPFENLLRGMLPFHVSRQIFAGAGKVGVENVAPAPEGVHYQLSQRADFFTTIASVDTLYNRPIINTRDEPHADARRYRRFHVICGDANFCEIASLLKVGTTLLVLRLLETGWLPEGVDLRDPVVAIKQVSRDPSLKWRVERAQALGGGTIGAVDIQRVYLAAAKERLAGLSEETDLVLAEWEAVLDRLESDPLSLSDTLDWAAKRALVEQYREAEGLAWGDPALQSIDLEYHNVDPEAGLYLGLEQAGEVRRLVTEDEVARAAEEPPAGSPRAVVRGMAVRRFHEAVKSVTWSRMLLDDGGGQTVGIRMAQVQDLDPATVREALEPARTPAAFVAALERLEREAGTAGVNDTDVSDDETAATAGAALV
jgi:Pup-ligase protein.